MSVLFSVAHAYTLCCKSPLIYSKLIMRKWLVSLRNSINKQLIFILGNLINFLKSCSTSFEHGNIIKSGTVNIYTLQTTFCVCLYICSMFLCCVSPLCLSPRMSFLCQKSAFILYLCLLVPYTPHILLQLCLKVIRNEKKQGVRKVDSGRSCGIHYYGYLCRILAQEKSKTTSKTNQKLIA